MNMVNRILDELKGAFSNEGCFLLVEEYEEYLRVFFDVYPEVLLDNDFHHFLKIYDIISFHLEPFTSSLWGASAIIENNPKREDFVMVICVGNLYWNDNDNVLGFYFKLNYGKPFFSYYLFNSTDKTDIEQELRNNLQSFFAESFIEFLQKYKHIVINKLTYEQTLRFIEQNFDYAN